MKALVTGASGFLGRQVCGELVARGHEVAALVRRPGSEPKDTRPLSGDLSDEASLRSAVRTSEPDCIVHLAAEIASQRSGSRIEEVNVVGTKRLLAAAREGGAAPRIVFSSTVVTGDPHGALLDERSTLPVDTPYGRSKQEGERLIRESGLPHTIVRPCHIYGPGGWYAEEIVARLRQPGRLAMIGRGENMWDVVRVEDVATAIATAAERDDAGPLYHVADDEPLRYREFMALTAQALGVGPPRSIPAPIASLVAGRHAVASVLRSARTDNSLIKRELGWSPRFPSAREGVPDAVAQLGATR